MKVLFYWNDLCVVPSEIRVNRKTRKGVASALHKRCANAYITPLASRKLNKEGDIRLMMEWSYEIDAVWGFAVCIKDNPDIWTSLEIATAKAMVRQRLNDLENSINSGKHKSLKTS
jgi:hypothetical protein